PPFDKRQTFQSDAIRREYAKAMTRLLEHPVQVHIEPRDTTQDDKEAANAVEEFFEDGLREVEGRLGYRLQGFLAHGQFLHCYGVLRVVEARKWPTVKTKPGGTYREAMTKYSEAKADAPFPFLLDVPRSDTLGFVSDRFAENGMSVDVFVESIASLEYARSIWTGDGLKLTRDEKTKALTVASLGAADRPEQFDHSGGLEAWGDMRVAQIWINAECYELAASDNGPWALVKSFPHSFGMTPVALAKALVTNHPDPIYRYAPFFLGLFRTKPLYDLERNLGRLLAEEVAVPKYWAELPNGTAWLDARGEKIVMSSNSALIDKLPAGAKLVKADLTIDPAFIQFLERSKEDLEQSIPETGFFDFGANTQPHTAVMAQMQANTEIADLKAEQANTFRVILQSMLHAMTRWADDGDGVVIRTAEGKIVEPTAEMLRGMTVEVKIEPNSGAQQVANEQYLREKTRDPNALYTIDEYLEATGRENTDAVKDAWIAEKVEMRYWPQVAQQEMAKHLGDAYVLTPAMTAVGMDGAPATPLEVLAANGFEVLTQQDQAPPPTQPGTAPGAVGPLASTLPPLQPDAAPTGATVGGIVA
ncbi:MAG: hypothetical protein NUW22_14330, partial [Acidobacteria bacterium]|nr:hypothetical protein [Acidobacteriota bacterium]